MVEEKISFSILMCSFNNENFIEEAIESVLAQNYPNWELIIVDDFSNDNSNLKIQKYLRDERIKFIHHNRNKGYSASLKTAIDNAKNEIIGILDSDDKLDYSALEVIAIAYRDYPGYGFIYSNMWKCDSKLENCKIDKSIGKNVKKKPYVLHPKISHFKTFKKIEYDKTLGFDINQKKSVDKDLIYKLQEVTNFKFINQPLYYYRQHEKGISQGKNTYEAKLYYYISKCKMYQRRQNLDITNFTKNQIYLEYYKITFYKLFRLLIIFMTFFRFFTLFKSIIKLLPHFSLKIKLLKLLIWLIYDF